MIRTSQLYYFWLYEMLFPDENYHRLAEMLHYTYFGPQFPILNDENRAIDGHELQEEFGRVIGASDGVAEYDGFCTYLELIATLSRRVHWNLGGYGEPNYSEWTCAILNNAGLMMTDRKFDQRKFDYAIETVDKRLYDEKGNGGLFPCENPGYDMRKAELWEQMNTWCTEQMDMEFNDHLF